MSDASTASFWAVSVPNQFHEMDEATVPDEVLSALRRAGSVKTSDVFDDQFSSGLRYACSILPGGGPAICTRLASSPKSIDFTPPTTSIISGVIVPND